MSLVLLLCSISMFLTCLLHHLPRAQVVWRCTDLYQITMAYAYWKTGQHRRPAHFKLFFRKNPFGGSFTIFAGLDEVLNLLASFRFSESDASCSPPAQVCQVRAAAGAGSRRRVLGEQVRPRGRF